MLVVLAAITNVLSKTCCELPSPAPVNIAAGLVMFVVGAIGVIGVIYLGIREFDRRTRDEQPQEHMPSPAPH